MECVSAYQDITSLMEHAFLIVQILILSFLIVILQLILIINRKNVYLAQMVAFHAKVVMNVLNAGLSITMFSKRLDASKYVVMARDFL